MFTGLIENVGSVAAWKQTAGGQSLTVNCEPWDHPLERGESVAVQGVCLTVVSCSTEDFTCDVLEETMARTNLRDRRPGAMLNLERALRMGDRLGGHMLSGHVDGTGVCRAIRRAGRDRIIAIECGRGLLGDLVMKGSVALDGISLTISAINEDSFEVNVIPYTWEHTSLASLRHAEAVNVETDMIGKYVRRLVESAPTDAKRELTMDDLRRAGFMK